MSGEYAYLVNIDTKSGEKLCPRDSGRVSTEQPQALIGPQGLLD
jgi:hypothetical protein